MYLFKNCECKQKFLLTDKVLLSDFFTLPFFRLKQKNTKKKQKPSSVEKLNGAGNIATVYNHKNVMVVRVRFMPYTEI